MGEQPLLFDLHARAWVARVWRSIEPVQRRKVVAALARMARTSLRPRPEQAAREKKHES
jgi:hypothetical protein